MQNTLRSLLFRGLIDLDLQGQIHLEIPNFIMSGLSIIVNTQLPE